MLHLLIVVSWTTLFKEQYDVHEKDLPAIIIYFCLKYDCVPSLPQSSCCKQYNLLCFFAAPNVLSLFALHVYTSRWEISPKPNPAAKPNPNSGNRLLEVCRFFPYVDLESLYSSWRLIVFLSFYFTAKKKISLQW
jgi:hypothetical protein